MEFIDSYKFDIKEISTPALAYLGDSVCEICVRTLLTKLGISSSRRLNSLALQFVRAEVQAEAVMKIISMLDAEEEAVFHRGRNIGHTNIPKSATMGQYRLATGFEALLGYLSLVGRGERINQLFLLAYADKIEEIKAQINANN